MDAAAAVVREQWSNERTQRRRFHRSRLTGCTWTRDARDAISQPDRRACIRILQRRVFVPGVGVHDRDLQRPRQVSARRRCMEWSAAASRLRVPLSVRVVSVSPLVQQKESQTLLIPLVGSSNVDRPCERSPIVVRPSHSSRLDGLSHPTGLDQLGLHWARGAE